MRSPYLLMFFLTFSASIITLYTAYAWGADMFSFFTKNQAEVTVVNSAVGAKLTKLTSYPSFPNVPEPHPQNCIKVKVLSLAPIALIKEDGYIETSHSAFVWNSASPPIALINNPENARFDVWQLDSMSSLRPVKKVSTNELSAQSKRWINYSVVDVACLPEQRLEIWGQGKQKSGVRVNISKFTLTPLGFADPTWL